MWSTGSSPSVVTVDPGAYVSCVHVLPVHEYTGSPRECSTAPVYVIVTGEPVVRPVRWIDSVDPDSV